MSKTGFLSRLLKDYLQGAVPYVGLSNNGNFGDEELFRLAKIYLSKTLIPDYRHSKYSLIRSQYFILGGGSILFSPSTLRTCEKLSAMGKKIIVWGSGHAGLPMDATTISRWRKVLIDHKLIGVRGYITHNYLSKMGISSNCIGDMGFLVNLEFEHAPIPREYIAINARAIPKIGLSEEDQKTRGLLHDLIWDLVHKGNKLKILSVFRGVDHPVIAEWASDFPNQVETIYYDKNANIIKDVLAHAKALVTMRMHPSIISIAYGTPTVVIDTRDKYKDTFSMIPEEVKLVSSRISLAELRDIIISYTSESQRQRQDRFLRIRALAKSQKDFCNQISATL